MDKLKRLSKEYADKNTCYVNDSDLQYRLTRKAVEYGYNQARKQLLSKSIDGIITFDYYGDNSKTYGCIAHDSFCLEYLGLKDNDNVKMIIIKRKKT